MTATIRIGTRDSQLALWQAHQVEHALKAQGVAAPLVPIKSEGDLDLTTPLYQMGVQGVFTRSLDAALLAGRIDVAVHSLKDVPTQLAAGIQIAAVLPRGSWKDLLVPGPDPEPIRSALENPAHRATTPSVLTLATSSTRRRAQWLHRFPHHRIEPLRGNVNRRMQKLQENKWDGAIFAAAGLERIGLRPAQAVELDWMLPAPAQGAVAVVCRSGDSQTLQLCQQFHDADTAWCTQIERDFLKTLLGGCSTPISALARIREGAFHLIGNVMLPDGSRSATVELHCLREEAADLGRNAALQLLREGGQSIIDQLSNAPLP